MSNAKLAEELEALAHKAAARPWSFWTADEDIDYIWSDDAGDVVARGVHVNNSRLIFALVNNLPAILKALRAEPDEAEVERVARAIYEACPGTMKWNSIKLHCGERYVRCMKEARAAIAAMKGGERG